MIRPDAVAIPGWSDPRALAALLWCLHSSTASVLMSDSTELDEVRRPWKEAIKRRVVSLFGSALVAGQPQRAYLIQLGMPADRIFDGFDVVDNEYFRARADAARLNAVDERRRLGLPPSYFLACCRFVEKKNLFRLIAAFAQYRQRTAVDAWDLVLIGDGLLRPDLTRLAVRYGLEDAVHMPGFQQYEAMPSYYGLAGAFVHASTIEQWGLVVNEAMAAGLPVIISNRCGCAPDLVIDGCNGLCFDPFNEAELADLMMKMASHTCDRAGMAQAARAVIAEWTLNRFTSNLQLAVDVALGSRCRGPVANRLMLQALIRRRA